jgi:hypothetical protein
VGLRGRRGRHDKKFSAIYRSIEALDRMGMELIEAGDPLGFTAYLAQFANTICGRHPIGQSPPFTRHVVHPAPPSPVHLPDSDQLSDSKPQPARGRPSADGSNGDALRLTAAAATHRCAARAAGGVRRRWRAHPQGEVRQVRAVVAVHQAVAQLRQLRRRGGLRQAGALRRRPFARNSPRPIHHHLACTLPFSCIFDK